MPEGAEGSYKLLTRSNTQTKLNLPMKSKSKSKAHSDSEGSLESNSLSLDSVNIKTVKTRSSKGRRGSEWEILEGLKEGQRYDIKPQVFTGYLHKKRKWPLKGWHKRYFVINKGILVYARGPSDITRGKIHGSVDIGLSVISTKTKSRRIDIDAEEFIYHLKAKRLDNFMKWMEQLKKHRLFRQHLLTFGARENVCSDCDNVNTFQSHHSFTPPLSPAHEKSLHCGLLSNPSSVGAGGRLAVCLIDSSSALDSVQKDLKQIGQHLMQLTKILEQISSLSASVDSENTSEGHSPNVKKDRKKFGLLKKKSNKGSSIDLASSCPNDNLILPSNASHSLSTSSQHIILSSSQTCLSSSVPASASMNRPQSLLGSEHLLQQFASSAETKCAVTPEFQMKEDFVVLAKDIYSNLKAILYKLTGECDRLKTACETENSQLLNLNSSNVFVSLRHLLNQTLAQNTDLKNRLNRVHELADLTDISSVGPASDGKPLGGNLSYSSSCLSASEFFDAEDNQTKYDEPGKKDNVLDNTETSSENNSLSSEEGEENSISSENSEVVTEFSLARMSGQPSSVTGRRTKLPAPRPNLEGLSLWNILCKNIGKDLSQVSMPVSLNEPLSMLQRLCEELEYSDLLDKASELDDPYERMVYVAAFAVSSYGSSYYRAGSKPFNPLLGETYECIREDKGFKYIAEQVSHHPPISVCHAESRNFLFWQDVRIKTKFWGKSMEFQPAGTANILLPKFDERYKWNKVTTCVHNLFSAQRWVDQYGELKIVSSSGITCKLTFVKASYWSSKRHEVHGCVTSPDGKVMRNIFGKWSEALYCGVAPSAKCIWRPGTMPEDYELYYGFTRFAIELNELDSDTAKTLPPTDTRFRPDQRLLEEGDLQGAENLKLELEQAQRERRKRKEEDEGKPTFESRWFCRQETNEGDEIWTFNNQYWEEKKNGFANTEFEALWELEKGMQESTSAQVHRSGRKSKAYSRHDHKCHKAKHKSTESLLEKGDRLWYKNYLSHKKGNWSALSVDSGLSQTETLSPLEVQFSLAYNHIKNENARLKNDMKKILQENEEIKLTNLATANENESLKADISLMKNLVYKLNVELEKFQNGKRKFEKDDEKMEKLPKSYEKNFLKPVLPLLKAYSEALQEKDETIKDLESEYKKFSTAFNDLIQENEKLYLELEKKFLKADGGVSSEVKLLKKDLEMAKRENDLLFQQIKLEKEKLVKVHSVFRVKVEEALKEKEEANINMEECKSDLLVLKGKYAVLKQEFERLKMENDTRVPLAVYSASINECQKLFQDLKIEYENEKQRLIMKIKEQEGTLMKQNKQEEEWAEEKNLLEKSNFNQFSEIESLRKKVSELQKHLEENGKILMNEEDRKELTESKKQLRDSNKRIEELSSKLAITKKQLQKAMLFAEDIVRGQEGLLLQLHAKQKENNYMTTQFGSLKNQLKDVEKGAQEGLNTIEAKIKNLETENYNLTTHNKKLEKLLAEKEEIIKKLEPTKDF